jgi:hypothetical protein
MVRWKLPLMLIALTGIGFACLNLVQARHKLLAIEAAGRFQANPAQAEQTQMEQMPPVLEIKATTYDLPNATVYGVLMPPDTALSVAVSDELKTVEAFASELSSQGEPILAVLNAGFFDPQNGKTTSHLVREGQPAGDPADNERLMENPNLQSYLPQILNRSEFRQYRCAADGLPSGSVDSASNSSFSGAASSGDSSGTLRYDITFHDAPIPEGCELNNAVGAGPQLLPADTGEIEGFTSTQNGELVRDAIGSVQPNARSAIALRSDGALLMLLVAQRPNAPGMTLAEVAEFAKSLGAVKLLNLDGGSSSSLYYNGDMYLGRLDAEDNPVQRPVKSVLVLERPDSFRPESSRVP